MEGKPVVQPEQSPVARLPVELVIYIFDFIARDPQYKRWDQYLPGIAIAITHVCAFWRNAALSPGGRKLWTHAPLRHNAACVSAFMERSHPLPIYINIDIELGDTTTHSSLSALTEAVSSMDRVEELTIRSLYYRHELSEADQDLHQNIYDLLSSKSAPCLKALSWRAPIRDLEDEGDTVLPLNLFIGQMPDNLRVLEIFVFGLEMFEHILLEANLTYLEIKNCIVWNDVGEVLDSLSYMPNLEYIVLDSIRLSVDDGMASHTYTQRSVNPPYLKTFSLSDVESETVAVFYYLRIPSNTRVHIELELPYDEDIAEEDVIMLRDALEAHYGADGPPVNQIRAFSTVSIGQCGLNKYGITLQASYRNIKCLSIVLEPSPLPT